MFNNTTRKTRNTKKVTIDESDPKQFLKNYQSNHPDVTPADFNNMILDAKTEEEKILFFNASRLLLNKKFRDNNREKAY